MSQAIKRMLHERRMLESASLTEKVWAERERVKAAFYEGLAASGYIGISLDPDEAWQISDARANLYPGPPTPIHLATKLRAQGYRICDCRRPAKLMGGAA